MQVRPSLPPWLASSPLSLPELLLGTGSQLPCLDSVGIGKFSRRRKGLFYEKFLSHIPEL